MKIEDISAEIWNTTYKGPDDNTLNDTWERQAKACSLVEKEDIREKTYKDFLWLLEDFKGAAGGRITANLGISGREGTTLFNCFVHAPINKDPDSISGIYDLIKAQAQTLKSEGGYGMNFSWIRPRGSYIEGIGSRTPGVLKFMELWDKSSEIITVGSENISGVVNKNEKKKIRKGAQMGVLCIWHPEIEDFINAKLVPNRLTKFNLSVGIVPGFMQAVINNSTWDLKFPDTNHPKYKEEWFGDILDWEAKGYPVIIYKTLKAVDLWDKIMTSTYTRNEPGVIFLDIANKLNPLYYAENIQATNPCGEALLGNIGICLLFSINLVKYLKKDENDNYEFDYESFKKAVAIATRFADNINDISRVPIEDYRQSMKEKRRIGIGVISLGSLHYILGIKYGSQKSLELIEKIFKIKAETELLTSANLGKEKGSFPLFDKNKYFSSYWWNNLQIDENIKKQIEEIGEMRNSHHSANAPTGNMSIYIGVVSNGIEPVFSKEYYRWITVLQEDKIKLSKNGFVFPNISKGEWFETEHFKFTKVGTDEILIGKFENVEYQIDKNRGLTKRVFVEDYGWKFVKQNFSADKIKKLNDEGVFVTTDELTVADHINTLKVISKYVNMSTSKTVNINNDYPYEMFRNLYLDAWKSNIKGITSYRAGTMTSVLEKNNSSHRPSSIIDAVCPKRNSELLCDIKKVKVQGEAWTFFIGLLNNKPYEVFGGLSKYIDIPNKYKTGKIIKNGKDQDGITSYNLILGEGDDQMIIKDIANIFENKNYGAFTRILSLSLRHGTPIQFIVEQLLKDKYSDMCSFSRVIARVLKIYIKDGIKSMLNKICPVCKAENSFIYQEGCSLCKNCSYSCCS
jgi:ribonucleoside-diphosphate reductase alpha chain